MSGLRSAVRLVVFAVALVLLSSILAVRVQWVSREARNRRRAELQRRACRVLVRILGAHVHVTGEIPPTGAYLVVSNHLGILDAWALAATISTAFVAKAEMASWPVMGWICRAVGVIFVNREKRLDASRFVSEVLARMRDHVPVTVFPEGTVGDGNQLLPFRTGAFEAVAAEGDLAVIPVFMHAVRIDGREAARHERNVVAWRSGTSLFAHAWRVIGHRRIDLEIRIGTPIPTVNQDRKTLARISRDAVSALGGDLLDST